METSNLVAQFIPFSCTSQGKPSVNPQFIELIQKSTNPHIVDVSGVSRVGKSSTCNNLISGPKDDFSNSETPFVSKPGQNPVSIGCEVYGPVSMHSLFEKHKIPINNAPEAHLFFIDTEGLKSLYGFSNEYLSSILTLLQISSLTIHFCKGFPETNNVSELGDSLSLTKFITDVFNIGIPRQVLYATRCDLEDDRAVDVSDQQYIAGLEQSRQDAQVDLTNVIKKQYGVPLNVVVSSSYKRKPKPTDIECQIYWNSIRDLIQNIGDSVQQTQEPKKLNKTISSVFSFFSKFPSTKSNDIDLKEMTKNIANQLLEEEINKSNTVIQKSMESYKLDSNQLKSASAEIQNIIKDIEESSGIEISNVDSKIESIIYILEQTDKPDPNEEKENT